MLAVFLPFGVGLGWPAAEAQKMAPALAKQCGRDPHSYALFSHCVCRPTATCVGEHCAHAHSEHHNLSDIQGYNPQHCPACRCEPGAAAAATGPQGAPSDPSPVLPFPRPAAPPSTIVGQLAALGPAGFLDGCDASALSDVVIHNVHFGRGKNVGSPLQVTNPGDCCAACAAEPGCVTWTLGYKTSPACYLTHNCVHNGTSHNCFLHSSVAPEEQHRTSVGGKASSGCPAGCLADDWRAALPEVRPPRHRAPPPPPPAAACDGSGGEIRALPEPASVHPFATSSSPLDDAATKRMLEHGFGNFSRLQAGLRRSQCDGSPFTVVTLGGSVTMGRDCADPGGTRDLNLGGLASGGCSWAGKLDHYVRHALGSASSVEYRAHAASPTIATLSFLTDSLLVPGADLYIVEMGVNDGNPARFDERGSNGLTFNEATAGATELLVRSLLGQPGSPAVLYLELPRAGVSRLQLPCPDAQPQHFPSLRHYDVPVISYRNAVCDGVPQASGTQYWKGNIHPDWGTHQRIADSVAHVLRREAAAALAAPPGSFGPTKSFSVRPDLVNTPEVIAALSEQCFDVGITDSFGHGSRIVGSSGTAPGWKSSGWKVYNDKSPGDPPGWISIGAGNTLQFWVGCAPAKKCVITATHLVSWRNVGKVRVTATTADGHPVPLEVPPIDALWNEKSSQYSVTSFVLRPSLSVDGADEGAAELAYAVNFTTVEAIDDSVKRRGDAPKWKIVKLVACSL